METKDYLTNYYERYDENGRLISKHGMIEYITTMKYVEKYLQPGMRVLEIGAATGRYSHALAQKGYCVDAVELVEHNIEIFKQNTTSGETVTITQGNAMDLSMFEDNTYDITLLLGPMYHLFTTEDKLKALSEAIRVTKKGSIVFVSYCNNDITAYHFGFLRGGFGDEKYKKLIDFNTFELNSTPEEIFSLYRKENIDELMSNFNTKRLHYVGTDMLTRFISSAVDEMDDSMFDLYMKYHFSICERKDMVGASSHMLDVLRKEYQNDI